MFLEELCQIEKEQRKCKMTKGIWTLTCMGKKQAENSIWLQTEAFSCGQGRMTQSVESRARGSEPSLTKTYFQAVRLSSNQETDNRCPAGFQNCYGPVAALGLLPPLFLNKYLKQLPYTCVTIVCWDCRVDSLYL